MSASAVLEDSEAAFADISVRLEKTKAEVRSSSHGWRSAARAQTRRHPCVVLVNATPRKTRDVVVLQVRARLEAKERAVVGRTQRDMEALEKELEELRRRDREIGQLLQSGDGAHFLQVSWRKWEGREWDWESVFYCKLKCSRVAMATRCG